MSSQKDLEKDINSIINCSKNYEYQDDYLTENTLFDPEIIQKIHVPLPEKEVEEKVDVKQTIVVSPI